MEGDPWIPKLYLFKPQSYTQYLAENLRVADLISWKPREWNLQVLQYFFLPHDVQSSQEIPLCKAPGLDIWIWHYTAVLKIMFCNGAIDPYLLELNWLANMSSHPNMMLHVRHVIIHWKRIFIYFFNALLHERSGKLWIWISDRPGKTLLLVLRWNDIGHSQRQFFIRIFRRGGGSMVVVMENKEWPYLSTKTNFGRSDSYIDNLNIARVLHTTTKI